MEYIFDANPDASSNQRQPTRHKRIDSDRDGTVLRQSEVLRESVVAVADRLELVPDGFAKLLLVRS